MPERVLVVAPAWVGDMVMSSPLLQMIRQRHQDAEIHVLAPEWTRPLLQRMPEVTHIHAMPLGHGRLGLVQRWKLGSALRSLKFTRAIVLPNSWKSALVPWAAQIPKRTGWRGEWRYGLLNDIRRLRPEQWPRMVDRFVALGSDMWNQGEDIPLPRLVCDRIDVHRACERHQLNQSLPVVALCPGAEFGPSKQWPVSSYAKLAQACLSAGTQVWIFGSEKDRDTGNRICAELSDQNGHVFNLAGMTKLEEAVDLLTIPKVVVSNDSGLMHVAAAVAPSRALVALYGSTSMTFTPPLAPAATMLSHPQPCSPCFRRSCPLGHHACMVGLDVARVWSVVMQALTQ